MEKTCALMLEHQELKSGGAGALACVVKEACKSERAREVQRTQPAALDGHLLKRLLGAAGQRRVVEHPGRG